MGFAGSEMLSLREGTALWAAKVSACAGYLPERSRVKPGSLAKQTVAHDSRDSVRNLDTAAVPMLDLGWAKGGDFSPASA